MIPKSRKIGHAHAHGPKGLDLEHGQSFLSIRPHAPGAAASAHAHKMVGPHIKGGLSAAKRRGSAG
jgi:hypothetical protein